MLIMEAKVEQRDYGDQPFPDSETGEDTEGEEGKGKTVGERMGGSALSLSRQKNISHKKSDNISECWGSQKGAVLTAE